MNHFARCLAGFLILATASAGRAADHVCPAGNKTCCCYRPVRHQGWAALESNRFRIHYTGPQERAVPLVTFCEETCESLRSRWIDDRRETWSCKCDIYLYPTARTFERGARAPAEMWGVADLEIGEGRVWKRRLHLRADNEDKLKPVLTHEMTHVVLAEHFCRKPIPRWADEGIAVFSEPPERQQRMLGFLKDEAAQKRLLPLKQVTSMRDGPQNERESELFYGQSGAVIEYLVSHHKLSEKDVLAFVGLCGEQGWERAITKTLPGMTASQFESRWKEWLTTREEALVTSVSPREQVTLLP
ncbi:hypothetical protein Pan44_53980 [Caulifigura coniformis]|uniref:Peptidase MA-like domain-containing protein n=1 Tax=Caulifigura coniformis TaxID=2527983 RepID=A0A517SMH5_9PLAN|nr:hypothetical protein [Caulifigura coniformis]QDT57330.1 hypothetical protein Pan44_53980 [Caulifigura coniformis]